MKLSKSIIIPPVILVLVIITVFATALFRSLNYTNIYTGISIIGQDVSDLSEAEAYDKIEQYVNNNIVSSKILLIADNIKETYSLTQLGVSFDIESMVSDAYNIGRRGNLFSKLKEITAIKKQPLNIEKILNINDSRIQEILNNIKQSVDTQEMNASIKINSGKFEYTNHVLGKKLNIAESSKVIADVIKSLDNSMSETQTIPLTIDVIEPQIMLSDINKISTKYSGFSTQFSTSNVPRTKNIKTACVALTGKLILPGEIFSMDRTLGPRTVENGYEIANVIINNKLVEGVGGGICQVTTTLYNTALLSGMEVVERRPHSLPLAYVKAGRDATIVEGSIDFKFKNTYNYSVMIVAQVINNKIQIDMYGNGELLNKTYKIRNEIISEILPDSTKYEINEDMKNGEISIVQPAKKGYRVKVYRDVYDKNNMLIATQILSDDTYKPQQEIKMLNKLTHQFITEQLSEIE